MKYEKMGGLLIIVVLIICLVIVMNHVWYRSDAVQEEWDEYVRLQENGCFKITTEDNCTSIHEGLFFDVVKCDEYIICQNGTLMKGDEVVRTCGVCDCRDDQGNRE